jgi:hypothetical protein
VTLEIGKPLGQNISKTLFSKRPLLLIFSDFIKWSLLPQLVRIYPFDHPEDQLKPLQEGQDIGQLMATTEDFTIH